MSASTSRPPVAIRAAGRRGGVELRSEPGAPDGAMPTLTGHFAVFNVPTEINSLLEGNFIERIAPGAFNETIANDRAAMKCLFQHGMDYAAGDKPLGPIRILREDSSGTYYEVPLLNARYVHDLIPGLEAGLYGASFCFAAKVEEWDEDPGPSEQNPKGLAERVLRQVRVLEFGPVTFPAYSGATAGVRSLTDDLWPALKDRRSVVPLRHAA
jgi:HK97 family phage prohead protease